MMQITDMQKEQQIQPLFRLGFRPFFLFGALFSVISIIIWVLIYRGVTAFNPFSSGYWWHIHEMIFGFAAAIIAGFLLTAVQNWTGIRGVQGKLLGGLFSLWLAGRLVLLFPDVLGYTLSAIIDLSFLPAVAIVLARPILAIKQYRNLFFVPLLVVLTLVNLEMYLATVYPQTFVINYTGYSAVLLVTLLMSVMAGRVTPMFTANGTGTTKANPIPWLEKACTATLAIATLSLLLQPLLGFNPVFFGTLLVFSGFFQGIRWMRWRPWITLAVPLLWSLHASLKFIWFGLILLGVSYIIPEVPSNHVWHLLTIGGMGGLILAMIARVSLGHTGRPLMPPKLLSYGFALIGISALLRVFGPWGAPLFTSYFVELSAVCWFIGYGAFIFKYGPMLTAPRADGRPG
ncbi:NnrS family protein [Thalassomonas haliotis]|uniref:NnrS family protein n=1 Tax=Thalassomonas haliotis TaxID=485448 RepID=A0ABY7VGY3_9GAMM|nr:NnrS family protein [Thalassomonas haliotis]WDE12682.1 NnrS family protein [Thalassomonas haliotis]